MKPNKLPTFRKGVISAGNFIFIRCAGRYSDEELFQKLDIVGYLPTASTDRHQTYVYVTEDTEWVHIADDWYYTLWHSPAIRAAVSRLASQHDIFTCSIGDADHSFDFVYYRDSQLIRYYVVADPDFRGGNVVEDFGAPLPGEAAAMKEADECDRVLSLASTLGISLRHETAAIRVYVKPREPRIKI